MEAESQVFQPSTVRGTADAPDGAMQFEIRDKSLGVPFIWVMPRRADEFVDTKKRDCNCKLIFPVVFALLPDPAKVAAMEEMSRYGTKEVGICQCDGRIIE